MIEDYVKNDKGESVKSYAPVSFGSKLFNTAQLKMSIYCKEFLSLYFALETFSHFIWGSEKPVLILTDNKSLTRFFQAKTIPPSLWNYVDRVTAFNIVVAHIPGKANAAADFLSRLQADPNETIELKRTDRIPIREIEIDVRAKLPDNTINELFADDFPDELLHVIDINTLITLKKSGNYEQTSQRLEGITENCTDIELIKYKTREETINGIQSANPMDNYPELETTMAQLQNEQQKDTLLTKVKKWKTDGNIPDNSIYSTGDEQKYIKQLPRLIIDNGILKRKYYNHDGTTLYDHLCVPKHMLKEILYRIHNSPTGGDLGITRTIAEFRKRFYYPNYIEKIADYIRNCSSCLQLKQIQLSRLKTPLQEISSTTSFPGDILQIDFMGAYPTTPYKYVLTAIDVFSKYLLAVPLTTVSASTVASALVCIMFNHSYIPKEVMSGLGTHFVSELLHELTQLLEIKISHASLKHPQTIGVVERSHAALARILKLNSNQTFTNWHKYVPLATFIHNTSYHTSIGCSPTVFSMVENR